jgi:threonine dehydrogenase-like Zn-dependent dehydrogenase
MTGDSAVAPNQQLALDQVIDASGLSEDGYVRVFTQGRDYGWLTSDDLAQTTLPIGSDGSTMPVWIDTWQSGDGRSGWSSFDIEADAAASASAQPAGEVALVGTDGASDPTSLDAAA